MAEDSDQPKRNESAGTGISGGATGNVAAQDVQRPPLAVSGSSGTLGGAGVKTTPRTGTSPVSPTSPERTGNNASGDALNVRKAAYDTALQNRETVQVKAA